MSTRLQFGPGGAVAVLFLALAAYAEPAPSSRAITLALKWRHQFQFAGYYAAVEKGFYEVEGLTVQLREPTDKRLPLELVSGGEAEYGVAAADLLRARAGGAPVVALAAIFQHSPVIVLSREDRGIRSPADLVGTSMMIQEETAAEVKALLTREGVDLASVRFVPHTWRVDEVIDGRVDASVAYITDQPNRMRLRGVEPGVLRGIDYGIDFYGDCLFTSEEEVRGNPDRVAAFRRASLKGWEYALANVEELIPLILKLPGVKERGVTADHLRYEAAQTAPLIQAHLVEIGHMNPGRWQSMANRYAEVGLIKPGFALQGFLYDPTASPLSRRTFHVMTGLLVGVLLLGVLGLLWNRQLRQSVRNQTAQLRASRQSYEDIYNSVSEAIYIHGENGMFIDVNRGAERMYGYSRAELIGKTPGDVSAPGRNDLKAVGHSIQEVVRTGRPAQFEFWGRRKNGEIFPKDVIVNKGRYFGRDVLITTAREVSAQKRAEEERDRLQAQLTQANKMESIGRLAGGVAHDFNNMLNVIVGRAELAISRMDLTPIAQDDLQEISKAAHRSADLTRQLLAFARKQKAIPRVLDLNRTVESMLKMLVRLIGENVKLEWQPAADLPAVRMDPGQLDQILANLCVNARDAISGVGRVVISTVAARLDEVFCAAHPGSVPGAYIRLSVADTGCGMDAVVLSHLFEPFYTTKELGQGTGLGLAMVYGIVKQNQGFIDVRSVPGHGSTFDIFLPVHGGIPDPVGEPMTAPRSPGARVILIVEDEPAILALCREVLARAGYRVLAAATPGDALRLAHEHGASIDLLLTDVVMPEMNGWELAHQIGARHPSIRRLFMSGYTADVLTRHGVAQEDVPFLQKPFANTELVARVATLLAAPRTAAE